MSCKRRPNRRHSHKKRHAKRTMRKKHIGRRKQRGGTLEKCMAECTASCRARYPPDMRKPNKNGWYIETREYGHGYAPDTILCNTLFNTTTQTTKNCLHDKYVEFKDMLPSPGTTADGYVATVIGSDYYWKKEGEPSVKITKENANWNIPKASLVTDADNDTDDDDPFGVSDEALEKILHPKS